MWKGDILVADIEQLEKVEASEIYLRRIKAKKSINATKERSLYIPNSRWYSKMVRKRPRIPRIHSKAGPFCEERRSQRRIQKNSEKSQPADETEDDAEVFNDFWSIEGDFVCRHQVEPRVHVHVPKEESFPIQLKYMYVTRMTHTNLDVLQESRIDDNWIVDVDRSLSGS